jgi:hypothetical protein
MYGRRDCDSTGQRKSSSPATKRGRHLDLAPNPGPRTCRAAFVERSLSDAAGAAASRAKRVPLNGTELMRGAEHAGGVRWSIPLRDAFSGCRLVLVQAKQLRALFLAISRGRRRPLHHRSSAS